MSYLTVYFQGQGIDSWNCIVWSEQTILKLLTCFTFRFPPNKMHSVFPKCKDNLLSISHLLQFSNSCPSLS